MSEIEIIRTFAPSTGHHQAWPHTAKITLGVALRRIRKHSRAVQTFHFLRQINHLVLRFPSERHRRDRCLIIDILTGEIPRAAITHEATYTKRHNHICCIVLILCKYNKILSFYLSTAKKIEEFFPCSCSFVRSFANRHTQSSKTKLANKSRKHKEWNEGRITAILILCSCFYSCIDEKLKRARMPIAEAVASG